MDNLWQATLSGIRWTLGARVALQLVSWPITLISMRLLEPRDYGLLALSTIVLGVITLVSDLGFGVTMVQAKQADEAAMRSASGLMILFSVLLAGVLVWSAPLIASWFSEPELAPVLRVMSLHTIVTALALAPEINLERQLRFKELSISLLASGVCGVTVTLIGALLGWSVWALVAGMLTGTFVRSGLQIFYHRGLVLPAPSLQALRLHIRAGGYIMGSRALWYWYTQSDQIILGRLMNATALGSYNVASQIAMLPVAKAMDTINRVAFPTLSRLNERDSIGIANIHVRLLGLTALYGIGVCWGLAAVADGLIPLLLGNQWQAAASALSFLALVAPLRMLAAVQNTAATAAGSPQAVTKELLLASLTVPLAVWVGALTGDIVNAAIAWVCTYPLIYLASTWFTARAVGIPYLRCIRPLAAPMLAGALMMASVTLVEYALQEIAGRVTVLAASVVAGALTYFLGMQLLAPVLVQDARRSLVDIARPGAATH
ncbi:MAG TPA: oligosaccharide flippase family protein [Burkholderiaceae bacterium]|nr:oligosaccharide flippase family protein [Burkholderiaceae bacterium]